MSSKNLGKNIRPVIVLTIGDPAGVGPEIVLKSLVKPRLREMCRMVVVGSKQFMEQQSRRFKLPVVFVDWDGETELSWNGLEVPCVDVPLPEVVEVGKTSASAGLASWHYVERAVRLVQSGKVDALATAPLTKASLKLAEVPWIDHTRMIEHLTGQSPITLLAHRSLRVVFVARHLSLRDSVEYLTVERIAETIIHSARAFAKTFRQSSPRMMVTGLNPHNGDDGLMGDEESRLIKPAIEQALAAGVDAIGPVAADSAFPKALQGEADLVVCMYHDQGHIAIKSSDWHGSIGITLGVDVIRTSADHGSALDIAGQGIAYPDSMIAAIEMAARLASMRRASDGKSPSDEQVKVLADEGIVGLGEYIAPFSRVTCREGRAIQSSDLMNSEVLVVRSVTKVNDSLLRDTPVRAVASATAGLDHIDQSYLDQRGIQFFYAPGSNARAVAEYVLMSLMQMIARLDWYGRDLTVGVVGVGHVGRQVALLARAMGWRVLLNDPPRQAAEPDRADEFTDLHRLLHESDVVTLHTPLVRTGPYPTFHLLGFSELMLMRQGSVLINTARGEVVDGNALLSLLRKQHLGGSVIDVWEGEPTPDPRLIEAVSLATPHVAGYTARARFHATAMLAEQLQQWLYGRVIHPVALPEIATRTIDFDGIGFQDDCHAQRVLCRLFRQVHDLDADHTRMLGLLKWNHSQRGEGFDAMRASYLRQHEFCEVMVRRVGGHIPATLRALGFQVGTSEGSETGAR